jgi:Protein of unknown function (DUF2723)
VNPAAAPRLAAPARGASLAAGLLAWLAYLAMTPAVSGDKDGSEFTLVLATLGAAHPTGYPLYTIAGHGFVLLAHALGASWPFAANAFSALGGAVAVGLLHALSSRLLRSSGAGARDAAALALLPAVAFGLNPVWTMETTLAEVYSWHVAWVMGMALFACWAMQALAPSNPQAPISRIAALAGLLVGLGLTHHMTSVFISFPLGLALLLALARRGALGIGVLAIGLGGFAIGVSNVAYLFWRASHPGLVQWPMLEPDTIWQHLLGAQYRAYLGRFAPNEIHRTFLARHIYPWLAPALLALLAAPFTRWAAVPRGWRIAAAAAATLQTAYVFSYGVPDPSAYFLPVLALGLAALPAWLAEAVPTVRRRGTWIAGIAALVLAVMSTVWVRRGLDRAETYQRFDAFIHRMWTSVPFEEGFVIFGDDMVHRLWEYQLLRDEKPRVIALNPALLSYPRFHAEFLARHGFDPLAGLPPLPPAVDEASTRALFDAITRRINHASPLPVVVFDRTGPSSRLLDKSASPEPAVRR